MKAQRCSKKSLIEQSGKSLEDKVTERDEDGRNLGHEIPEGRKTSTAN